jgi:hypothetical protein
MSGGSISGSLDLAEGGPTQTFFLVGALPVTDGTVVTVLVMGVKRLKIYIYI